MEEQRVERRKFPRATKSLSLKIGHKDFFAITQTKNISCSGAYCEVESFVHPMTKLSITLFVPLEFEKKVITKKIDCKGIVVRTEPPAPTAGRNTFHIGIYFTDISRQDKNIIARYVDYHLKKEN